MPNLKEIAKSLNLSISTVSRILNGKAKKYRISDETIHVVNKYVKEVGYTPNLIAKGLQASQTFTICLMVPNIANPFFSSIAKSIEKWAARHHYSILLVDSNEDIEKEELQVEKMLGRKVDGIIVAPVGSTFEHFNKIKKLGIPLIFVDRYFRESDITYVTSDNFQGSYEATEQLLLYGHKRICLISGAKTSEIVQERIKGYLEALKNSEIALDETLILGNAFTIENGYESTYKAMEMKIPPTALFAMNNSIGLGVLQAIKDMGINVPGAVSVIIFDEFPYFKLLSPTISSVEQASEDIGEKAVKLIMEEIHKIKSTTSIKIPTRVIIRESIRDLNT